MCLLLITCVEGVWYVIFFFVPLFIVSAIFISRNVYPLCRSFVEVGAVAASIVLCLVKKKLNVRN